MSSHVGFPFAAGGKARVESESVRRDLRGGTQLQGAGLHRLPHAGAQARLPAGLRDRRWAVPPCSCSCHDLVTENLPAT